MSGLRIGYWMPDELELLRARYPDQLTSEIAEMLGRPVSAVYARAAKLGLSKSEAFRSSAASGRLAKGRMGRRGPRNWQAWTEADIEYLKRVFPHERTANVAQSLGRKYSAVAAMAHKLRLQKTQAFLASEQAGRVRAGAAHDGRGLSGRFSAGLTPWNKGQKYPSSGRSTETQFRPGQEPHNTRPVGSYRISQDGYLQQKFTAQPGEQKGRWRSVHRLVWEAEHGPTPPGHVVTFLPGARTTELAEITLDKLELITQQEQMRRNSVHRLPEELASLTRVKGVLTREINKHTRTRGAR